MKQMKRVCILLIAVVSFTTHIASHAQSEPAEEYVYDENGRIEKAVYEDGSYETYSYDANGNLISVEMHEVGATSNDKTTSVAPTTTEQDASGNYTDSDQNTNHASDQAGVEKKNSSNDNDGASTGDAGMEAAIGVMLVSVLGVTALEVHRRKKRLI